MLYALSDVLIRGDMENSDMNLYWDSWDRHHLRTRASPRPIRSRITRSSVPSEDSIPYHNNNNLNSNILAQASSVISLMSTSPPCTPLSQRQKYGKYEIKSYLFNYLLRFIIFKKMY